MRNLSTEFKEQQNSGNRNYLKYADFTFTDGSTLSITDEDLWSNGFKFEDAVSQNGSFDIGAAIVNKLTLQINNFSGKYTDYIWDGARVVCHIGLELSTGIEKIRICTMTVTDAPYQNTAIISLTCEDSMRLFDRDYSDSKLTYPATRLQIIQDACEVCGVTLQSTRFDNDDLVIKNRPDDSSITFRQVIAWVAQMGCQWAKSDEYGRLCLGWYEREVPDKFYNLVETPWKDTEGNDILDTTGAQIITIMQKGITSTDTNGFTPWLYDLEITGVKVTEYVDNSSQNEAKTYQSGKSGYVIEISDNKLIQEGSGEKICQIIVDRCVGLKFRPFTTGALTNIAWEAGDSIAISDRKGNVYKSYLTSVTLNPGNFEQLECSAKSVSRSNQKQYTLNQQIQAENKKNLKDERTAREKALEELSQRLAESSGTYTTVETQPDGSNIYYLHNKPQLSDSDIVWKMTAEAWAVSTDGGQHWNGGMTVDGDVIARILTATGVNADWINTGTIKAIDKDGNTTFLVDITTGRVVINADSVQVKGKDVNAIAKEKAEAEVNDFISNTYTTDINNLQSQIDGQIETFFYDYEPTLQNIPASDWTTNEERKKHEGDLFYWKSKGYAYRFMQDGATWKWQLVQDTDITLALAAAEKAQDTANGKRRVFVVQPEPPYDIGDLWAQGSTGDLMRCKVARASGAYSAEDWEKASKYTDDSSLTTFLNGAYKDTLSEIQSQLDGKSEVWYQATDPSLNWTTRQNVAWIDTNGEKILDSDGNEIILVWESEKSIHNGDLWYNTSNNTQWIYQNGNWEPTSIPDSLLDKIDGKSQVFVKEPVPPYELNDIYFTGTEILVCISSRETGEYNASDWTKKDNYTDDTALTEFIQNVYTDDIAKIQETLDGQIMTYFYDYTPTLDNLPASDWKTEEDRENHEGDLFYNKTDKRSYRFFKKDNVWTWDLVLDPEVNQALEQAQAAQDTADGKRRVFVTTPSVPYDVGDLWVQGETGDIMRCRTAKTDKQTYDSADWIKASKYTDDTKAKEVEKQLGTVKEDLQVQIDGKIESYNQESDPSTSWTTETLKVQHKGDLWYNPTDKVTKRWSGTEWTTLDDATALAAQELAKNKRRVFSSQPTPPYDIGDLWCQGGSGDIMQCKTAKPVGGTFDNLDWQRASKYTDDSTFNTFLDGVFKDTINNLKTQIDGKIETWYQPNDPSLKWTKTEEHPWLDANGNKILDTSGNEIVLVWESEKVEHEGDLWHNTSDNTQWIFKSGIWQPQSIPDALLDKVDGKSSVYTVQPTPPYYSGDLWMTTDSDGKASLKVTQVNRLDGAFNDNDWIDFKYADKDDIKNAIDNYDTSLGQDEVFNKLTKGGTEQGIYIEDGKVYINAKYILAGLLAGERINGRGLKVIDDNNNVTLEIDSKGNVTLRPTMLAIEGKSVSDIATDAAAEEAQKYKTLNVSLSKIYQAIPTDADGKYTSFPTDCKTQVTVLYGDQNVTSLSTITFSVSTGVSGSASGSTYTVTGLSADSGIVTATATYNNLSVEKQFTIAKQKQGSAGEDGKQGEQGKPGIGVADTIQHYLATTVSSGVTKDTTGWTTTIQNPTAEKRYLWSYQTTKYTDTTTSDTTPHIIGVYGEKGADGKDGTEMTSEEVFNKLTDNGKKQGIYTDENGNFYVSGEYLRMRGVNVVDGDGKTTFAINKETGAVTIAASSFALGDKSISDIASEEAQKKIDALPNDTDNLLKGYLLTQSDVETYWDYQGSINYRAQNPNGKNESAIALTANGSDCYLSAKRSNNQVVRLPGTYQVSVWLRASTNMTIKVSLNRVAREVSVTNDWKKYEFSQSITTVASSSQLFTIGGFSSFTSGILAVYRPEVTVAVSSEHILNLLTDNGVKQGLYMLNNQLYINGQYIKALSILAGSIAAGAITADKIAAKAVTAGKISVDELSSLNATLAGFSITSTKIQKKLSGNLLEIFAGNESNPPSLLAQNSLGEFVKYSGNGIKSSTPNSLTLYLGDTTDNKGWTSGTRHQLGRTQFNEEVKVFGDFSVSGTKSVIAKTENYGNQLFYCYETPTPTLGDFGGGVIGKDGIAIISIDDIFQESTETAIEYYVFLQNEGEGQSWVSEKSDTYFVVKGTPGLRFAWELKAKQKNKEYIRFNAGKEDREVNFETVNLENVMFEEREKIIQEMEGELL